MAQSPFMQETGDITANAFGEMPIEVPSLPQEQEEDLTHTPIEDIKEDAFNENLAEKLKDSILTGIAANIISAIEQDKESRTEWEQSYIKGMKYLGWKLEDFKDIPFMSACRAFDTTLSHAVISFYARVRPHLFPRNGPADFKIKGIENQEEENRRIRLKEFMNYYLTNEEKDYYAENDRLLMYLPIVGCCFRKTYIDPLKKMPVTRFIDPQDLIINNNCVSLLSSDRITHRFFLSKQEMHLRQISGLYRDVDIPGIMQFSDDKNETTKSLQYMEGINLNVYERNSLYEIYEAHVYLALDEFDYFEKKSEKISLPLPYIVTICAENQTVLSIRRNWKKDDLHFKRRECFTQWNYLPGLGLYGMGLTQLIGSNSVVLTSVLRQLVDAGTLKNFPGGLKSKGLRIENNDKAIGPSEFLDVETGGLPIRDVIMTMPYSEPSIVLKELRNELMTSTQVLAATSENQIVENNVNAPVQTTLALLEVVNRTPGSIFEGLYRSLSNELGIIYDLFGEVLPDQPYPFKVPGADLAIMRADFNDRMHIIPIADPQNTTQSQKIFKAKSLQEAAIAMPQYYNMREVNKRMLEAMRIENIEEILVPAQEEAIPKDPITENMDALAGRPIQAGIEQDHDAHMAVHAAFLADPNVVNQIPDAMKQQVFSIISAHQAQHVALKYLVNMQLQMGMQMPDPQMLLDPQIQNQVAIQAAQVAQEAMERNAEEQRAKMVDPNAVLMADIEQRREASYLKDDEMKLKAKTDIHKTQLKFETEKLKMKTQKEIAHQKNQREETIAHMKTRMREHKEH